MDPSTAVPFAGSCATCGAPLQAGRAACPECGAPVTSPGTDASPAEGGAGWSKVTPEARPDLRPPGPNQWYSDRFRAANNAAATSRGLTREPARPATVGLFSDLPFQAPAIPAGWLVVVGAWASVLAFLLPWASAPGLGYFDAWGLYKGSHVLAFIGAVAIALVAILPVRLSLLLRLSLLPLLLGAFELGLIWEWVGAQTIGPGVWLLLLGALLCVSGGVVVASRVIPPPRPT